MLVIMNKKVRGSGILVVILASIAFSVYAMSSIAEPEHLGILLNKYEENNKRYYEKYINNIDEFYNLYNKNSDVMYM